MPSYRENSITPFSEYQKVLRHTEDLPRLERLHLIEIRGHEMHRLIPIMAEERRWSSRHRVELALTGRRYGRGFYRYRDSRITVTDPAPLEVLIHELAHHDNQRRGSEVHRNPHGPDFVCSLDLCAEIAERRLGDYLD